MDTTTLSHSLWAAATSDMCPAWSDPMVGTRPTSWPEPVHPAVSWRSSLGTAITLCAVASLRPAPAAGPFGSAIAVLRVGVGARLHLRLEPTRRRSYLLPQGRHLLEELRSE